jgi:PTS system nitrogen regulatory IIA component
MPGSLENLLAPHRVLHASACASKKRLLEIVSSLIVDGSEGLDENRLCESFNARERLGSTGIGEGIAIPHCRLPDCKVATAALITLEQPIEFAAIDDRPVDIVFALVVPDEAAEAHLQMLARLAGLFSDAAFRAKLRSCPDAAELHHCMLAAWSRGAAAPNAP